MKIRVPRSTKTWGPARVSARAGEKIEVINISPRAHKRKHPKKMKTEE